MPHPDEVEDELARDLHRVLDAHREALRDNAAQLVVGKPGGAHRSQRLCHD